MKYRDENGDFQDLYFKTGDTLPIGTIVSYGSLTAPTNWLVCDGSAVSRTAYAALFAAIGTSYGSGDGSTTFNLPDLRGRVPVGKSTDTEFDTLGETGGEKTHTLTTTEMPTMYAKSPTLASGGSIAVFKDEAVYGFNGSGAGSAIATIEGGGQAHNILQPYQVVCFIIKAEDAAGVVANVTNTQNDSTKDTYSCDYINDLVEDVYSTSETLTNKVWINNKPIYRKVIDCGYAQVGFVQIPHNISNIDFITGLQGFFYYTGAEGTMYPLSRALPTNMSEYGAGFNATKTYIELTYGNSFTGNQFKAYAIIEYTKTTD